MPGSVYLDANVVIAVIETRSALKEPQSSLIAALDTGQKIGVTSQLTLAECLVYPFANRDTRAIESFMVFLGNRQGLKVLPVSRDILVRAARLRADTRLKLPDAIHLVTAIETGCTSFVTNDRDFKSADAPLKIVQWDQLA